jgi:hypothetical protein
VPFLIKLAANPAIHERDEILYLINDIAIGYDSIFLPKGMEPISWRKGLEERKTLDVDEEKRKLDQWVSEADNDKQRKKREWKRDNKLRLRKRDLKEWENSVVAYDAVRDKAVPTLCSLLENDPNYLVRSNAAHTLSFFPESVDKSMPILHSIVFEDSENIPPTLLKTAVVAFVLLYCNSESSEPDRKTIEEKLRKLLTNENLSLRWAAATGLARLDIYDATVIRELAEAIVSKTLSKDMDNLFYLGDLAQYATECLQEAFNVPLLSDSVLEAALDPILNGSTPDDLNNVILFRIVCKLLWKTPENNPLQGSNPVPFENLHNEKEKTFFKSMAQVKYYHWESLLKDLKFWKLPRDRDDYRRYVGLPLEGPYNSLVPMLGYTSDEDEDIL